MIFLLIPLFLFKSVFAYDVNYNQKIKYYVRPGDTFKKVISSHSPKTEVEKLTQSFFIDQIKYWNPHIKSWSPFPVGERIYLSRPGSPFLSEFYTQNKYKKNSNKKTFGETALFTRPQAIL